MHASLDEFGFCVNLFRQINLDWDTFGHYRWDYIQEGTKIYKDMDRLIAFKKALTTWGKWVDANVDPAKTEVFYQGVSPSHYK